MNHGFRPRSKVWLHTWAVAVSIAAAFCGYRLSLAQEGDPRDPTKAAQFLRSLDKNGDGQLTPDEYANSRAARMVRSLAQKANLNPDGALSIAALAGAGGKTESKPGGAAPAAGAPSFGGGAGTASLDYIERAEKLIKENDKNNNGVLDGAEVNAVPSKYKGADLNGDGTLTRDEIVAKISDINAKLGNVSSAVAPAPAPSFGGGPDASGGRPGGGSPGGGPGGSGPGGGGSGGKRWERPGGGGPGGGGPGGPGGGPPSFGGPGGKMKRPGEAGPEGMPGQRKSFRVRSATERFPKGLPDWFARSDADGDGQVSMAEYSVTWTDAKAQEFAKLDINEDGFVTVAEALASVNGGKRPSFAGPGGPPGAGGFGPGGPGPGAPGPGAFGPGAPGAGPMPAGAPAGPPQGGPPGAGNAPVANAGPPNGGPPSAGPPNGGGGAPGNPGGPGGPMPAAAGPPSSNLPPGGPQTGPPPSGPPGNAPPGGPANGPPPGGPPRPMPSNPAPPAPGFGSPQPTGQ